MTRNPDEFTDSKTRICNVYIPPFKKKNLEASHNLLNSREHQEKLWNKLEKNIRGEINKLNFSNIEHVLVNILKNNIIRGRGILVNCVIRAQLSSQSYTSVICYFSAIINCNIPDFGSLLLKRLINQFRISYSKGDKFVCKHTLMFLAQLINQKVVHELTALQICLFLIEKLTDDSIEVCIDFILECGEFLLENSPQGLNTVMNKFRRILQEGKLRKRTNFLIERVLNERRINFKNYPANKPENELFDTNDQITHFIDILDEEIDIQEELDHFIETEPNVFEEENKKWEEISKELLSGLEDVNIDNNDEPLIENNFTLDLSEKNFVILRKKIYLCIMNSLNFEECTHRLLKMNMKKEQIREACTMILDCCSMERTYQKFFSLVAERLCIIREEFQDSFKQLFSESFENIHHLETTRLRHITKFYSYLLSKDAIPWSVLFIIVLSEKDTASSSRIFIKILFQELSNNMGIQNLDIKLNSPEVLPFIEGIFPKENIYKIRFSINFFTAIGLSALTQKMRDKLSDIEEKQTNKVNELCFGSEIHGIQIDTSNSENITESTEVKNTKFKTINSSKIKLSEQINSNLRKRLKRHSNSCSTDLQDGFKYSYNIDNYKRRDRSFSREF
ncbi:NIC and MI domain-containing nucampholin-like protein [Cryptosporidium ubiquitum]|uniref:NIC and MI domain-containing nucampholin-like protein n=1 Tax=Cryptosporidium ubiquitum TaxID=857276 RepID=A0A1J4ML23_9CRYT|nr:NIC and MI domain-containing nucampholin-like protein [Cryptosporidium ubiquitum]OII73724.1 NIC and MI domain-containing nucampholin-like protein [Cryptosporidium ubiquitum]